MTDADLDLGYDLTITKVTRHAAGSGTWICGTLHGHRFSALVFPEHAEMPDYELNESRISMHWGQRLADRQTEFGSGNEYACKQGCQCQVPHRYG